MDNSLKPDLIETGVKYFLGETLKKCHEFKVKYNNLIFNICLFILFFILLGCLLLYKHKGKLSPQEKIKKENEKHQYILSKIKNFHDAKRIAHQELITGLPGWDSEYDIIHRNYPIPKK